MVCYFLRSTEVGLIIQDFSCMNIPPITKKIKHGEFYYIIIENKIKHTLNSSSHSSLQSFSRSSTRFFWAVQTQTSTSVVRTFLFAACIFCSITANNLQQRKTSLVHNLLSKQNYLLHGFIFEEKTCFGAPCSLFSLGSE